MTDTLDNRYFEWLYSQIGSVRNRNPSQSYWDLTRLLYRREFVWLVLNDDNRVEDGKDLRNEFLDEEGFDQVDPAWLDLGCSMFEMLVALSRRAAFESSGSPAQWFWVFIDNLGFQEFTDSRWCRRVERVASDSIDRVIFRTYEFDGQGGIFPLRHATTDQRKVELWYQMSAYLLEVSPPR